MKIRTKLILNYSILSIILLIGFSLTILFFSIQHRKDDFKNRLQGRAKSAVKMLIDIPQIDSTLLSIIDDNTLPAMNNLTVNIYDSTSNLLYSFKDRYTLKTLPTQKKTLKILNEVKLTTISFKHKYLEKEYKVEASAFDIFGYQEINYLVRLIWFLLLAAFVFIIFAGIYNAYWSLKPFRRLISEIESFNLKKNKKRLNISGSDEVAQLSQSFNDLLNQLLKAYEDQKSFVTHVSHELRTPVTALLGQIEISLNKDRKPEEYRQVIHSAQEEGLKIAQIINSLLELAEANMVPENIELLNERIDELLFTIIDEFKKDYPLSRISIRFNQTPEDDKQLICFSNQRLLHILFRNLIENALKFSENKRIEVSIDYIPHFILIQIIDQGIGISKEDLNNVFIPLFRGQNVNPKSGHGLGLSIAKKIADLHKTTITIDSELNVGTTVLVKLPSID